jgi:hypothetical protein
LVLRLIWFARMASAFAISRNNFVAQSITQVTPKKRLAAAPVSDDYPHMSMNAVDPVRRMRALSAESRVLRRGVLGDRVDGRSREGRFLTQIERELVAQIGGSPSFTQKLLIRRLARGMLRLELLDEKQTAGKALSAHDGRSFSALSIRSG